ncbi:hypothetical protein [Nonomuraea sp. NPDC050643]|uniref:hypothetical protein n=1 Tax=Nonomuraea sp. NPDC050643 TaxID=3155660 RepID=UPI0033D996DD
MDARRARTARITLDDPAAAPRPRSEVQLEFGPWGMAFSQWSVEDVRSRFSFVPVRQKGLRSFLRTFWLNADDSYDLVARYTDGFPADPSCAARRADLAEVTAAYRGSGVAAKGTPLTGPRLGDDPSLFLSPVNGPVNGPADGEIGLPGTRTYHRSPGFVWDSALEVGDSFLADGGRAVGRGHSREVWNAAVTGPSVAGLGAGRTGDEVTVAAGALFADGGAGRAGTDGAATGTATLTQGGRTLAETGLAGCRPDPPERCVRRARVGVSHRGGPPRLQCGGRHAVPAASTAR